MDTATNEGCQVESASSDENSDLDCLEEDAGEEEGAEGDAINDAAVMKALEIDGSGVVVQCPIGVCNISLDASKMLLHFLIHHIKELDIREVYVGKPIYFCFDPVKLPNKETVCMGFFVYGGKSGRSDTRPGMRGISRPNLNLPVRYTKFTSHLPVALLIYKSPSPFAPDQTKSSISLSKSYTNTRTPPPAPAHKILKPTMSKSDTNHDSQLEEVFIWLVAPKTSEPIFCAVTAYRKDTKTFRSATVQVTSLEKTQNPEEFTLLNNDFLKLETGDLTVLVKENKYINLEVIFNEYD